MPKATYDSVVSHTVTANTNELVLSNIPQTYTDLVVVINWIAVGNNYPTVKIDLNNSGSYTYYGTQMTNNASTVVGYRNVNAGFWSAPRAAGIPYEADRTVSMKYEFLNYTNTNMLKVLSYSAGGGQSGIEMGMAQINSTSPLQQIKFYFAPVEFKAGTVISAYGILKE